MEYEGGNEMGFRLRKSVSLFGGAFRINFSKSGIGYSYGGKGARVTKTANGRTRTTLSIPGTGISYVTESGGKKKNRPIQSNSTNNYQSSIDSDQILERTIENSSAEGLVSVCEQDFISAIKRYRTLNKFLTWLVVIWMIVTITAFSDMPNYDAMVLLWLAMFVMKLVYKFAGKVKVTYSLDEYGKQKMEQVKQVVTKMRSNSIIWQINNVYVNQNTKVHAGAGRSLSTGNVAIRNKTPKFIKVNVPVYEVKLAKEKVYVFPDKLMIVKGNKIGSIHMDDLDIMLANTRFIPNFAPRDARVVGHTWQYVNKNGGPDKRFKNNMQLPICDVGTMSFKASQGLDILLYLSNVYTVQEISAMLLPSKNQ